jgi:hypothetical protein
VVQQGDALAIEPASPEVVYVPYYDPRVAYGSWWWPAYPPVYWAPWPGYYAYPGYPAGFAWGVGITVGAGFFFSGCDWRQRHVTVVNVTHLVVNRRLVVNRPGARTVPTVWQHDPVHRRGVPYHIASVQQRFGGSAPAGQRRDFRWQGPLVPATRNSSLNRPEVHGEHLRPNPRRPDYGRPGGRDSFSANPAARSGEARPEFRGPVNRPPVAAAPQGHAGPGNVPRSRGQAPQAAGHNPQPHGFANQGQSGNRPAPSAGKAHGEGRGR